MTNKEVLKRVGIPSHLMGYDCWDVALNIVKAQPQLMHQMGVLYTEIGNQCKLTRVQVERNMRTAVWNVFDRLSPETSEEIFGNLMRLNKDKLTNSEFLGVLYGMTTEEELQPKLSARIVTLLNNPKVQAWLEEISRQE